MKFIALLLGLIIERLFTNVFHLGELRLLDRYFDAGLACVSKLGGWPGVAVALLVVLIPVAPVAFVAVVFTDILWGAIYILFAVVVLLFCLGPRDLGTEVDDFVEATRDGDVERARHVARELLETDPPATSGRRALAIEEAVFVQSTNRSFGVILWFVFLGPAGAWLFRVSDLMRRRALFEAGRLQAAGQPRPAYVDSTLRLHGILVWLPARMTAITFALAGSFEPAVADWRDYYRDCSEHFFEVNDEVVARAGLGALGNRDAEDPLQVANGAEAAMSLVNRSLIIWIVAVAVLTAVGASV